MRRSGWPLVAVGVAIPGVASKKAKKGAQRVPIADLARSLTLEGVLTEGRRRPKLVRQPAGVA